MKAIALREHTEAELRELNRETMRKVVEMRISKGGGEGSASPIRKRTLRREVARIKTVMRERGIREHG